MKTQPEPKTNPACPLELYQDLVRPEFTDYNGHMNESCYLQVFSKATDAFLLFIGMTAAYHQSGYSFYTVETHLRHLREAKQGTILKVRTQLLGCDEKRVQIAHAMYCAADNLLLATAEHMLLHVNMQKAEACAVLPAIAGELKTLWAAQKTIQKPDYIGKAIRPLAPLEQKPAAG